MGDAGPPSAGSPRRQHREVGQWATEHRMLVSAVCPFALTSSLAAPVFPLPPLVNASSTGYYFSMDIHIFFHFWSSDHSFKTRRKKFRTVLHRWQMATLIYSLRLVKSVVLENLRHITHPKKWPCCPYFLLPIMIRNHVTYFVFWILNGCICIGTRKVISTKYLIGSMHFPMQCFLDT